MGLAQAIIDDNINQIKSVDMLNATDAAKKIMDSFNKEIMGMLVQEAKESLDEKAEEEREAAKKRAEEKEKLEEKIENHKEEAKGQKEILEKDSELERFQANVEAKFNDDTQVTNAQKDIRKILAQNNLISEDIKK